MAAHRAGGIEGLVCKGAGTHTSSGEGGWEQWRPQCGSGLVAGLFVVDPGPGTATCPLRVPWEIHCSYDCLISLVNSSRIPFLPFRDRRSSYTGESQEEGSGADIMTLSRLSGSAIRDSGQSLHLSGPRSTDAWPVGRLATLQS